MITWDQIEMTVNYEVERMWKELGMAYFKVLLCHLLGGLRKSTKNLSLNSQPADCELNLVPPRYKAEVLTTQLQCLVSLFKLSAMKKYSNCDEMSLENKHCKNLTQMLIAFK
jgi:hypothetical protein